MSMYEAFSELLSFAEKIGEIKGVLFHAEDGTYCRKGADITGVTADGDEFTISLDFKKVPADAD